MTERHCAACHDPRSMVTSTYLDHKNALMMDFFEVLAGLHGFFGENPAGDDSDSSSDEDEDMEDLEAGDLDEDEEDEDQDFQDLNLNYNLENIRFNFDFDSNFKVIQKLKFKN